jgi:YHS domain-containing protein
MKKPISLSAMLFLALALTTTVSADEKAHAGHGDHAAHGAAPAGGGPGFAVYDHIDAKYVCMVNDQIFPKVQIPVEVEGKTYYGCCAMCKDRLAKDAAARTALDPQTGETVDKATAHILAVDAEGNVGYFKNAANAEAFVAAKKKGAA